MIICINNAPYLNINKDICLNSILWGNKDAGGWYICQDNIQFNDCIIFSYGLGADWSFDNMGEKYGCIIHGFDPSGSLWRNGMHGEAYSNIDYSKQYPSKSKIFHSWGLGVLDKAIYPPGTIPQEWPGLGDPAFSETNDESWDMRSIEQTMKDLLVTKLSILKIDVEGAEWAALTAALESKFMRKLFKEGRIEQLLIEWHWDPNTSAFNSRHETLMKRIESLGFIPWNIERHVGSDCCLDVSYKWVSPKQSLNR